MAKTRVYELARDLNMSNKALLDKIEGMDVDVKSHMSSLDDDMVSLIKSNILGTKDKSAVEEKRVKPAVIRRRKKQAPEKPVLKEAEPEDEEIEPAEAEPVEAEAVEAAPQKAAKAEKAPAKKKAALKKAALKKEAAKVIAIPEKEAEAGEPVEEPEVAEKTETAEEPVKAKKAPAKKKATPKKTTKQAAAKIIKLPTVPPEGLAKTADRKTGPARAKRLTPAEEAAGPPSAVKPGEASDLDAKKKRRKKKAEEPDEDNKFFKKKISFRKKAIVEGTALYDDTVRVRGRKGRKGAKTKQAVGQKTQITTPKAIKRRIKIDDTIILSDLSKRMGVKANEMIQKLMGMGVMATVNQTIDFDTAILVAAEFEYELERASFEEEIILSSQEDDPSKMAGRPPVVTIMGHVDHGKTSLLDVIRKSSITDMEAGGITQHIGAYHVNTDKGQIVFLDTPGHEAFTAMRARGAKVTDLVILVVAADDGVMPQTIEAINHSKAAGVPIIVAINKIDKPDAEPERVMRELSEEGIVSEEWGGDVIFVNVSAKQNKGVDDLLDMILLQAEVLELKANPDKLARGHVIEAKLDSGRGPAATILIQEGTLHAGQSVVCGIHYGKIRAILDDKGKPVDKAGPSIPVEILGLTGVPVAGDEMITLDDEKNAKQVSAHRMQKQRAKELARSSRMSLEGLFERMEEGEIKELNVIIKADVQGSIEALKDSLIKLGTDEVKINVVHSATGTITESDVSLATVSNAIIIGFNVRPGAKVHELAAEENVDMRFYDIIYNAIKDIKGAMLGIMDSKFVEKIIGRAEVRETFVIPKKGTIAGSYVTDGKIERGLLIRLLRDGVIIHDGKIGSLRRFKDDAREVMAGYECGIGIENYNDIKLKDTIECYYLEEIKPSLE